MEESGHEVLKWLGSKEMSLGGVITKQSVIVVETRVMCTGSVSVQKRKKMFCDAILLSYSTKFLNKNPVSCFITLNIPICPPSGDTVGPDPTSSG